MKSQVDAVTTVPRRKQIRLPRTWPYLVGKGDVEVKIYRNKGHVRGKNFTTYAVSYYANGRRQLRRFVDFASAKALANTVAGQKAQGALGAAGLTPAQRVALEEALTELAKQEGTFSAQPGRLIEIVRDYTAAIGILPRNIPLATAARFWVQKHPLNMPDKTVHEVVTEFINDRRAAGCSSIHMHDLETRLGQFTKAFVLPINYVSPQLVQQWIYALKRNQRRNEKPLTNRSKQNMLRQVVSLFNFARRQKYICADLAVEIAEIPTPRKQSAPIGVYTPDEISKMLAEAEEDIIPALAIGGFAGLRLAEIARLDWREIRISDRYIVVEAGKSKTATRRLVPICDNLLAWLTPYIKKSGPVDPSTHESHNIGQPLGNRFLRTAGRAKVAWKRNGLRHSYISYRVATLKDVPEVALESGNSPAMIFSNYRALATEAEAKAWFAVMPSAPNNVVSVPQFAAEVC